MSAPDEPESRLFGDSTPKDGMDVLSMRDAADRASKLATPAAAMAALRDAEAQGDGHMATAIARHAHARANPVERAWGGVVDAYASRRPAAAEALSEIRKRPAPRSSAAITERVFGPQPKETS